MNFWVLSLEAVFLKIKYCQYSFSEGGDAYASDQI